MAFPSNPTKGDMHVEYGSTYYYSGTTWIVSWAKTIGSNRIITRPTAPSGYLNGTFWLNPISREMKQLQAGMWITLQDLDEGLPGTPPSPIYVINSESSLNEASSMTVHVDTVYVASGTTLSYEIIAPDGSSFTSDDLSTPLTGTFVISSGSGAFTITAAADATGDDGETFVVFIRDGQGNTVATQIISLHDVVMGNGYNGYIVELRSVWDAGDAPYSHLVFHKTLTSTPVTVWEDTEQDDFLVNDLTSTTTEVAAFALHFSDNYDSLEPNRNGLYILSKYIIDNLIKPAGVVNTPEQFRAAFYQNFDSIISIMQDAIGSDGWYDFFALDSGQNTNWTVDGTMSEQFWVDNNITSFSVNAQSGRQVSNYRNFYDETGNVLWAVAPTIGAQITIPGSVLNVYGSITGVTGIHDIVLTVTDVVVDQFDPTIFSVSHTIAGSNPIAPFPNTNISDGGNDQYDGSFGLVTNRQLYNSMSYGYGQVITTGDAEDYFGPGASYVSVANGPIFGLYATNVDITQFGIGENNETGDADSGADGSGQFIKVRLIDDQGNQGVQLGEAGYAMDEFVVTVNIPVGEGNTGYIGRLQNASTGTGTVYWGDGTWTDYSDNQEHFGMHVYDAPGTYTIRMKNFQISACPDYVTNILQWSNVPLIDCATMFYIPTGDDVQSFSVTGIPNTVGCANMSNMFRNANYGTGRKSIISLLDRSAGGSCDIQQIETYGTVTNTVSMFRDCDDWNPQWWNFSFNIVTNTAYMFYNCTLFNRDIWNMVEFVTDMSYMFANCTSFNHGGQPYAFSNGWYPVNAQNMNYMFLNCTSLNQPMENQFQNGVNQSQPTMEGMFQNCSSFNQNLSGWSLNFAQPSLFDSGCVSWTEPKPTFAV